MNKRLFESNPEAASAAPTDGGEAPAPIEGPTEVAPLEEEPNLFSQMAENYENDGNSEVEETAAEETPAVVAPAEEVAEVTEPESPQEPVTPEETPAAPEETAEAPSAPAPPSPEEVQEQWKTHRDDMMPQLSELYKLSEDEVTELEANPGEAFPKMAAKLHFEVYMSAFNALQSIIPGVVGQTIQGREAEQAIQKQFFDAFPDLNVTDHGQKIMHNLAAYQQATAGTQISREDMIKAVGAMTMMQMGVQASAPGAAPVAPSAPAVVPATPINPGGAVPTAPTAPGEGGNMYSDMADTYIDDGN